MDPRTNPFAPGAGTPPPELAGRERIIEDASIALDRVKTGLHARSQLLLGLRGVGKTVLLSAPRDLDGSFFKFRFDRMTPTTIRCADDRRDASRRQRSASA